MKHLITIVLLFSAAFPGFSQSINDIPDIKYPVSTERILIGLEPGIGLAEIAVLLENEKCFLPADEGMWGPGQEWLLGWMDPAAENLPKTDADVNALLRRLENHSQIRYAHPFIVSPEGALFGVTDEFSVKLRDAADYNKLVDMAAVVGVQVISENKYISKLYHLRADKYASSGPVNLTLWFQQSGFFEYADMNYLVNPLVTTNDTYFIHQWSLQNDGTPIQGNGTPGADMSVTDAWNLTTGNPNIRIAIIDSGTDTTHEDLVDNLLPGFDANGGGSKGWPNTNFDNDAHGTNCAGIVAAKGDNGKGVAGVCYDCSIFPVKVFYYLNNPFGDPFPFSDGNDMADAFSWAWQVGNADVMSNSWGVPDIIHPALPGGTGTVENAIRMAQDSARNGLGALMFFSSGNDGGLPLWPGRLAGCISVNATSMCDERKYNGSCDGQSWEGNWGDSLSLGAPGVRVATTDMGGALGFDPSDYNLSFGGTSAACPNAAGVGGLVLSANAALDYLQLKEILETTCDKVGGYSYGVNAQNGTWSSELGYGRINAFSAVQAANPVSAEAPIEPGISSWDLYPNPAQNEINLVFSKAAIRDLEISLFDLSGRKVFEQKTDKHRSGSYKVILPILENELKAGLYVAMLKVEGVLFHAKMLIIK